MLTAHVIDHDKPVIADVLDAPEAATAHFGAESTPVTELAAVSYHSLLNRIDLGVEPGMLHEMPIHRARQHGFANAARPQKTEPIRFSIIQVSRELRRGREHLLQTRLAKGVKLGR
jgi:hypothetical protein